MRTITALSAVLITLGLSGPALAAPVSQRALTVPAKGRSVSLSVLTVDLADPATVLAVQFAHGKSEPDRTAEPFGAMVKRANAAALINGSFFSVQTSEVFGNFISAGRIARYFLWEDRGSAFTLSPDNTPSMTTMRAEGWPDYRKAWLSLACGPRLVRDGKPWLFPRQEGFEYDHVYATTSRSALGLSRDGRTLWLCSFLSAVSLEQEAAAMQQLGAYQAMNLDGGASVAQAFGGRVVVGAGRPLTNVLAIYDSKHPAPADLLAAKGRCLATGLSEAGQLREGEPPHFAPASFR